MGEHGLIPDKALSLVEHKITVLLVDDQAMIGEAVRRLLADEEDIVYHYCGDPTQAIKMAGEISPTVILQDLVMPEIDGLTLVKFFRANQATRDVPLIVLSTKEEATTKAEAFAIGANDYLVKLPDRIELIARIRYHSQSYINLLERNEAYEALVRSQEALAKELTEAAEYVKSLLPDPLDGDVQTRWEFITCSSLGGDAFGYHWLDDDHFAVYLLDVCGHGVGAALLSISAINVLRSQSLPNTDFHDPGAVLGALNDAFPMEANNDMYFTIWYGVYDRPGRRLIYASGGHPASILVTGDCEEDLKSVLLRTPGMIIGAFPDITYENASADLAAVNKLYIFSDGAYEVEMPDGAMWTYEGFESLVARSGEPGADDVQRIVAAVREIAQTDVFLDDLSLVQVVL